ncbi:MAG: helix-turn-helix transcriptional regulator [Bacilli bacterium]|nr:helix-turn-helix transcriptional regulator [Bacilli bacterium]
MKIGEKLQELRKAKGMTQEDLADYLGVSRQSVSKWELDLAFPETEKLVKISQLFQVSLDSLFNPDEQTIVTTKKRFHYEYRSKRKLFGLPLVHINIGFGKYISKGIISIGNIATGFVSIGLLSIGLISLGIFAVGLISLATFALGILFAVGAIAVGLIAIGAIALGIFTIGAISIGYFSIGALSIGKYIAYGDYAKGLIAVGKTKAAGTHVYQGPIDKISLYQEIDLLVPSCWSLFIKWMKSFIS